MCGYFFYKCLKMKNFVFLLQSSPVVAWSRYQKQVSAPPSRFKVCEMVKGYSQ